MYIRLECVTQWMKTSTCLCYVPLPQNPASSWNIKEGLCESSHTSVYPQLSPHGQISHSLRSLTRGQTSPPLLRWLCVSELRGNNVKLKGRCSLVLQGCWYAVKNKGTDMFVTHGTVWTLHTQGWKIRPQDNHVYFFWGPWRYIYVPK